MATLGQNFLANLPLIMSVIQADFPKSRMEIVISLPLFLRERRVNFCESLETVRCFEFHSVNSF